MCDDNGMNTQSNEAAAQPHGNFVQGNYIFYMLFFIKKLHFVYIIFVGCPVL
jgi:hypothetical protein